MFWFTQAFVLLYGIQVCLTEPGYGNQMYNVNPESEAQSDVQAPAYVPAYLKNQHFSKTSNYGHSGTKTYSGTKTAYGGTKTAYGGTKTAYGGTKTAYGGTKNVPTGTPSRYSEHRQWYSGSNEVPEYSAFYDNANKPYQQKCTPECKNSGICVDTNTCKCPANFHGTYCEFEKKPCLTYPPVPMNAHRRCNSELCTITCLEGHKFIDGSTVANMRCMEGQWQPSRADFTTIPDCQPECDPPCQNGGVCLALNSCSCPTAFRGPHCEYSASVCNMQNLAFNGGYKCYGDNEKLSCSLSCPPGAEFSSAPEQQYSCEYSNGTFQPQPIPHCVFTDVVVVAPTFTNNEKTSIKTVTGGNKQIVVQSLTPQGGTCLTWAGVHYKTFDGKVYTFKSPCQHILLREPKEHMYTVAIQQKACKRHSYCPSEITVYLEEKAYVLATGEDGSVIFRNTKRLIPIPAVLPGIRVSMPSDYVLVNLDAVGVTLKWDTNNVVQIEGSVLLWNNTEGLCGTLDGNPANDLMSKDGSVVKSVTRLASSWQLHKIGDICESSPTETAPCASEAAEDVLRANKFCNQIISMNKFRKCSKTMDVLQFLETCKWDYCACASTLNSQECACNAVSVYAKECLRHGVEEIKNWRDADTCPMTCPDGKVYMSCGPDVQASCALPRAAARRDNGSCAEGCFCPAGLLLEAGRCLPPQDCPCRLRNKNFPPGSTINKDCNKCTCEGGEWKCTAAACGARCRAVGDPHYTTFDGLRYDFMGRCTYTMLQADNLTVEVENVACSGSISENMNLTPAKTSGQPSCTKVVSIRYGGADIQLRQGGGVAVGGRDVTELPIVVADVRIRAASSLFLIVQLPNKVDLWWDGNTRIFIDVPPEFHGKTKGLCGTFNMNQQDDFLTPENDIEQSTSAFANKWRTRELCAAGDGPGAEPEHPCRANVENKEAADKYCGKLKSNIFEACHWHVDVEPFYEACLYDMCACEGDVSRCLCPVLGDYAMMCAKAGVKLQWRYNVLECELQCSGGQEYSVCADSCLRKCSDTAHAALCTPSCVEGCACKEGELLDDSGECVPVALCPCFHKGLQFQAGYKEVRAGKRERELCTCVGARWDCVPASAADAARFPPAEDLRSSCSATDNMEFTTCALAEPLTCKNMHLPAAGAAGACRAGCACRRGFVLDAGAARCVPPARCPCHHGGASYPDGHRMREDCNECECNRGNWTCTTMKCAGVCTAWGDSHISTFDGSDYDFEGVCSYLLAKGNLDGNDGFEVEIQNVPCGTTGATCSKSTTLKVGSGVNEEIVSLTRNAPLPDVSKLKRIKLRAAGAFVFLDVPSLGASVQWDRRLRVYVRVDNMWLGRVKGLCGNYNGDTRDDYQTPSGGGLAESSALIFADSWKLKPNCPKAQPVTDHCKQRPERREWAGSMCGAMKRYPFTLCHGEVSAGGWVERCERDACACDAGGDCECACAALAAYAHACAHRGITFNWRTQDLCPMQCDEECSSYDGCVSPCPTETCDNTLHYSDIKGSCEQDTCVEGCKPKKPCAEGTVYRNSSSSECVPRAACRPPCTTLADGTEVAEGGLLSEDACHECRCSKGRTVCTGLPCSTEMISSTEATTIMQQQPLQCKSGWTPWLNRGIPETESNGVSLEIEPLPKLNEPNDSSPKCSPSMLTDVQCRTVGAHLSPKDTGLDAECSLERGLVCRERAAACPDFEIRGLCTCQETNPCTNITTPNIKHPTDCTKFYECPPSGPVVKDCGPGTFYNPNIFVCDSLDNVVAVRPECAITSTESTSLSTSEYPLTDTPEETPPTETSPAPRCPPGEEYRECAFPCNQLCDHFRRTLMEKGRCIRESCVEGCVRRGARCTGGARWRDQRTCVEKKDCTCLANGQIVKPGKLVVDGCLKCQCLDNDFHCDTTACVSINVPLQGSTHGPYILKEDTTTTTVPDTTRVHTTVPDTTRVHTTVPDTTRVHTTVPDTTRVYTTVPDITRVQSTTPEIEVYTTSRVKPRVMETPAPPAPTTATPLLVKSTATPPPDCSPTDFVGLMWNSESPLADSAFSASSVGSELFLPQHAQLNGHTLDNSAGSWNPAVQDTHQWLQVELPRREPVYGVALQGSPLFDQYVTSYEIMYGDDGVSFSTVDGPDGKPKVFRGPVEHDQTVWQTITPPIEAKFLRIHPLTWHEEIAVRMDILGCKPSEETDTTTEYFSTEFFSESTTESPMQCDEPLGLAGGLPLAGISTSSNPEDRPHLTLEGGRGWRPLYSTPGEWVMFNFTSPRNITGIKTRGGDKGWVTAYKILYTTDLNAFSSIVDKDKNDKVFPANYDSTSVMEHEFRLPIRAQYLKVLPLKWKDNIEMQIEPIGCFEPYPVLEPPPPSAVPPPAPCQLCPDVQPPASGCGCGGDIYFDGESCVPRAQCPCVLSFMTYPVGSTFSGANCDECVCKLGGVTDCEPGKTCTCDDPVLYGDNPNLVPKLIQSTCECSCTPCPAGARPCPTDGRCVPAARWCDGLADCADDELACPPSTTTSTTSTHPPEVTQREVTLAATPPIPTTTAAPFECPVISCPPGYHVALTSPQPQAWGTELPPPRPRYSYTRYIKGGYRKGGYSGTKSVFSKGGFGGAPPSPPSNQAFTLDKPTAVSPTPAPTKQECPQFKCIPKIPPFPRPGSTPAPVVCSVVTCPPGYSLKLETLNNGFNRCPQYSCEPPAERGVFCNVTGRTLSTFDGTEYKYDVCFHILARDNRHGAWAVLIRKKCRDDGCQNELLIHQDDQLILVKPSLMIEYNNYEYTVEQTSKICFQKNSFDVTRLGNGILVKSRKYNFTAFYSNEGDVKIGVFKSHMGTVDGLCGAFDGDASNDRRLPTGQIATSTDQFGRAWAKPGLQPDACLVRVASVIKQKRVWELCDVIMKEPISRCGSVLNLDKWRSICLEKVCACSDLVVNGTKRTEEQCRCVVLEQLLAECLAADRDAGVEGWRLMADCPAECPAPLVHYDCYRKRCAPTCWAQGAGAAPCPAEDGQCFPGCYCPDGTLRKGDSCVPPADCLDCTCNGAGSPANYVTFEGDELPFLGNCTYLASRDRNNTGNHKYQVYATSGPCAGRPGAACVRAVHLLYGAVAVTVAKNTHTQKLITTIGSAPVFKYPVKKEWGTISLDNGQDVSITLPDIHVQLTVLQANLEFTVRVPSYLYGNRTEGLCGVCAGYLDVLLTSNGTATDDIDEYGKSWQASPEALTALGELPQAQCDVPPPPAACVPPPPASNPCYQLYNADRFGECRALVDPAPFVESCEADVCANASDACAALGRYAAACRQQGVCLHAWRNQLCPYPCESPLVYRACVACEPTCDDSGGDCNKQPVEGCFCPEGKVRVNNTCIEPQKCFPCDANKEHFAGEQWQENACTKCTCSKVAGTRAAHVACTTDSCTTPVCRSAEELAVEPPPPDRCCPTYVCVPKPKAKECVEPKKIECGFGQVLKQKNGPDECPEFACECKPASECEDIPPEGQVELLEPGVQRLLDLSGCCPRAQLVCRTDKCPPPPTCPKFHDLTVRNISGKCCPEYECELPKNKCLVKLEWESSPSGGEKARATPELMLKDIDAVWLDGPCRSCRCAAGAGAGAGAGARCSETACPAPALDAQFVIEPRPVPFACCPELRQVACRDQDQVYKAGESWPSAEDACAVYKCVQQENSLERLKTVQSCEQKCQPGWQYVPAAASGQCCGTCGPVACMVDGQQRPIGEHWSSPDFCTNYTCVNINGTLQVQSSNESCPEVSDALKKQFVLKEEKTLGKCCSTHEPVACRVGNNIYQEGQTWPSSDPCKNLTCSRDVTGRLAHSESIESCVKECKEGWLYTEPPPGRCCGTCAKDACVIEHELKKPGSTWYSADNCTTFTCSRAGAEVFVTSERQVCPDLSHCKPEHLANGTCCATCNEPPLPLSTCVPTRVERARTVGLVRAHVGPHGACRNTEPLPDFAECRGACDSSFLYDTQRGVHQQKCSCCSATKYGKLTVLLSCEDGSRQPHQVAYPEACACTPCGAASGQFWDTKSGHSGTKNPTRKWQPVQKQELKEDDETDAIPQIYNRFKED